MPTETQIDSWETCKETAEATGLSADMIAHAFGVENPGVARAKAATTQNERWKILETTPNGSEVTMVLLEEIFKNTDDQEERWKVYLKAPSGSKFEQKVFQALLENATEQADRKSLFWNQPVDQKTNEAPLRALLGNATSGDDLLWVHEKAPTGSDVWKEAVRRYVLFTLDNDGK